MTTIIPTQTALLTGVSSGIGRAIAALLAERDPDSIAHGAEPETVASVVLKAFGLAGAGA